MIQALIGPVTGLLDKFIEDKDQKAKLAHEIATMSEKHAQQIALAQIEVNKAVNKIQIKKAVQEKYNVTVEKVRTQIYGPERSTKYTKKGIQKTKSNIVKKAIVQLSDGDSIDFYNSL